MTKETVTYKEEIIKVPIAFRRRKDLLWSISQCWTNITSAVKEARNIIGFDPTHIGGFNLICRDARGIYRLYSPWTSPNFLKTKFVLSRVPRWSWYYRDEFTYKIIVIKTPVKKHETQNKTTDTEAKSRRPRSEQAG